ncbi:MAG: HAMP domain-containing histidine kinase [Ruminococcus sp.]|jgi:signal transduction histidine kinase|nr:HAMP domain-containing histidine kinase [Ruminococcus sp.]
MLKKTFSDIFTAVAGITTAVLLLVSAVLCGTALIAFENTEFERLISEPSDAAFFYDLSGRLLYTEREFDGINPPMYINPEALEKDTSPSLSTVSGSFPVSVFHAVTPAPDGYRLIANSALIYNEFALGLVTATVLAVLFGVALIFIAVYFVTKRFIAPIEEMTIKVVEFEGGDYSVRMQIDNDNEIGFLADSLNRLADNIEQTEDDRKAFVANVSHELRTPMTTIAGFIDGILDNTIPPEDSERYLSLVSVETKRLSRLVNNMLFLSAFDAGKMPVNAEEFDILPEFLTVLMHFRDAINRKNITVNAPEYREFTVHGDVDLLNQVIFNLIENAVKFTEDDGVIDILLTSNDSEKSIKIRNSGGGLRSDEITKVFERFYKADASRGKDRYGSGLGLSIVSGIVRLHKGKLIVRSEPGNFTEFEIALPIL